MTDIQSRGPLKCHGGLFMTDENTLQDLQSQTTVLLLKIVLTKETKESFQLLVDVFQLFCFH
jgi:hypothetical protein